MHEGRDKTSQHSGRICSATPLPPDALAVPILVVAGQHNALLLEFLSTL